MQEIETKVLEVNVEEIKVKLKDLGAKETQDTRLVVDWYCPKGIAIPNILGIFVCGPQPTARVR